MAVADAEQLALIEDRIRRLSAGMDEEFAGMTVAERAAERSALARDYVRRRAAVKPPDFSGMKEAERAAEAERQRQELLEKAHQLEEAALWDRFRARVQDFDPKQGGGYCNRLYFVEHPAFDLDEESPLGPMRFADAVYRKKGDYELCESVNIFSVKIASSDVGFPLHACVWHCRSQSQHRQQVSLSLSP